MNATKMKRILINICKYVLLILRRFCGTVPYCRPVFFTAFKTEEE